MHKQLSKVIGLLFFFTALLVAADTEVHRQRISRDTFVERRSQSTSVPELIQDKIARQLRSLARRGNSSRKQKIQLREANVEYLYNSPRTPATSHAIRKRDEEVSGTTEAPVQFFDMEKIPASNPCSPRTYIERLTVITNSSPNVTFHPPCMFITKCDGCCGYKECIPAFFERKRYEYTHRDLGKQSQRFFELDFPSACTWRCESKKGDCTPAQIFNVEKCRCECPYRLDCDWLHEFKEDTCTCDCIDKYECQDYRARFSEVDCRCHRKYFYDEDGTRDKDNGVPRYQVWPEEFAKRPVLDDLYEDDI